MLWNHVKYNVCLVLLDCMFACFQIGSGTEAQAVIKVSDSPASASQMVRLQACIVPLSHNLVVLFVLL